MRIVFVVDRPTQFEAPFFRFAASDKTNNFHVLFTGDALQEPVFDPELGRRIDWGINLLDGFSSAVAPAHQRRRWLFQQIAGGDFDLLIANGYTRREYLFATAAARHLGIATALRLDSVVWPDRFSAEREVLGGGPDSLGLAPIPETDLQEPWQGRLSVKQYLYSAVLMQLYDLFLGVGTLSLRYLEACGVPTARSGLFPYAVDVETFRSQSALSSERRLASRARLGLAPPDRAVLAVSKLSPREAPWDLVRAAHHLPPDVKILLAGDGPTRPALETEASAIVGRPVRFLGYVPYPQLPELYASCDLFVHPAADERWGVSVAEALACGLRVVASSRVGAAYDLVVEGRNGEMYRAGDAEALAGAIRTALTLDPVGAEEQSRSVLEQWSYAATWNHLLDAGGRIFRRGGLS